MSLKDKFAGLTFKKLETPVKETPPISDGWSRMLGQVRPISHELHTFFSTLAGQGVYLKNDDDSGITIVLDGECFNPLPAVNIEINPKKRCKIEWPDGAALM